MSSRFFTLIDRLDRVLADLNEALARHDHSTVATSTKEMCQCLLELRRVTEEATRQASAAEEFQHRLDALRSRLRITARALELQISAVREVVSVLSRAERASEADTTYAPVRRQAASG